MTLNTRTATTKKIYWDWPLKPESGKSVKKMNTEQSYKCIVNWFKRKRKRESNVIKTQKKFPEKNYCFYYICKILRKTLFCMTSRSSSIQCKCTDVLTHWSDIKRGLYICDVIYVAMQFALCYFECFTESKPLKS